MSAIPAAVATSTPSGGVAALAEPGASSDYSTLKRVIGERGLLERNGGHYAAHAAVLVLLACATGAGLVLAGDSRLRVLCAVPAAFLFGQLGFLAHDATHGQVFRRSGRNYVLGVLLFNLLLGGSRGWWSDKHNLHHGMPNQPGRDPDVEFSVLALDPEQARAARGVPRRMMRVQAQLILPLLLLEAINIHAHSVRFVIRGKLRHRGVEALLLGVHGALYLVGLPLLLGVRTGLLFIAVHQALLGLYLGAAFITNHIGMAVPRAEDRMDFLRSQVLTARNLRANPLVDRLFGSLTCQIEHHLFPTMPRRRLRTAAPVVRAFCEARGVAYRETGLVEAYGDVLRHLAAMARLAR